MKHLTCTLVLAACSNAAAPGPDALHLPTDASGDAELAVDAPAASARVLVLNEVAAGDSPDWFEIVNATLSPVALDDYVFVDAAGDFAKAVPFPAMTLAPGAYFTQEVDGTIVPFKLSSDEELWIYHASDHALSDGVDWAEGASPAGGSYARVPDIFGEFVTAAVSTRGTPNQ